MKIIIKIVLKVVLLKNHSHCKEKFSSGMIGKFYLFITISL